MEPRGTIVPLQESPLFAPSLSSEEGSRVTDDEEEQLAKDEDLDLLKKKQGRSVNLTGVKSGKEKYVYIDLFGELIRSANSNPNLTLNKRKGFDVLTK